VLWRRWWPFAGRMRRNAVEIRVHFRPLAERETQHRHHRREQPRQGNIEGVQGESIVALCDIDSRYLGEASTRFPKAKTFQDWRKLLERKTFEAVVISTADQFMLWPPSWP